MATTQSRPALRRRGAIAAAAARISVLLGSVARAQATITPLSLTLFFVALIVVAACGGSADTPRRDAVPAPPMLRTGGEELKLATLQVGTQVYADVDLRLAQDGTWQLLSVGAIRSAMAGEQAQAVLVTSVPTVLGASWRPTAATIVVRRMHIGAKVFGNVALRLVGPRWFLGDAMQQGHDERDLQELTALTMADYRANPELVATEKHHTVLHTGPADPVQRFPLKLQAKRYRFCMDAQDGGSDTLRLFDAAGTEVLRVQAGEACVQAALPGGLYQLQHEHGGGGTPRTVFVRPPAAPAAVAAVAGGQAADPPEYWALYLQPNWEHGFGFLSFNVAFDAGTCTGVFDAAAQLSPTTRPGEQASSSLLDRRNFFRAWRDAQGNPSLGLPLYCDKSASSGPQYGVGYGSGALAVTRVADGPFAFRATFDALRFNSTAAGLQPVFSYFCDDECQREQCEYAPPQHGCFICQDPGNCWLDATLGFGSRIVTAAIDRQSFWQLMYGEPAYYDGLVAAPPDSFQVALRFFPQGMPIAQRDASGTWALAQGEVALFANPGCTGAALVSKHEGVLTTQSTTSALPSAYASLQVGPNAVATFTAGGKRDVRNQTRCDDRSIDLTRETLQLETTTEIRVETNSCEYCNLAGLDFSGRTSGLQGVKLQHANLTDTNLSGSDLSRADLRWAVLQGADLSQSNLEGANLCSAALNGKTLPSGKSGPAASLPGAHLKNANLSGANLDGANFANASFYSSTKGACQPLNCAATSCASAYKASMDQAKFTSAYLANVDMSNATARGANFFGALLFGASFHGADLGASPSSGATTSFDGAFLQGADFSEAMLHGASFSSAYVELDADNDCSDVILARELTRFPGYQVRAASGTGCVPATDDSPPSCVRVIYAKAGAWPATDRSNVCPDGKSHDGGCSSAWPSPVVKPSESRQLNSTCKQPALCGPLYPSTANTCWNAQR